MYHVAQISVIAKLALDVQADLSLRWAHMSFRWFCHAAA